MRFLIAFDSFKGSLAADEAGHLAAATIEAGCPDAVVMVCPLADGGEGTADILLKAADGERVDVAARDPLGRAITAHYGWCETTRTAIMEMAAASGLTLLRENERNPLLASTTGTGNLLIAARARSPEKIWMGVGGSATVDGGVGAAMAAGWQFLDERGRSLAPGGGSLIQVHTIIPPAQRAWPPMEILCDVTNPLTGPRGAARVFGPQKGATPEMVERLEEGLCRLADVVQRDFGVDIASRSGGGAAGGLAAGAMVWFGARMVPGIERVLDETGFDDAVRGADWVITGEGRFDHQSLHGKVVSGVLARVKRVNPRARVAVLAGRVGLMRDEVAGAGVAYADAITPDAMAFSEAKEFARELLARAVKRFLGECAG